MFCVGYSFVYAAAPRAFDRNLSFGMENNADVVRLQEFLTKQGFYNGPVTGNFLTLTFAAVKKFQNAYGISPVSGFFGPLSRGKANEILLKQLPTQPLMEKPPPPPPVAGPPPPDPTSVVLSLQLQELLKQIAFLQEKINALGAAVPPVSADGLTGPSLPQAPSAPTPTQSSSAVSSSTPPVPTISDTTPPSISGVKTENITPSSARIKWFTDEPATTGVLFGTSYGYYPGISTDRCGGLQYATSHCSALSGLSSYTLYYFEAQSEDPSRNVSFAEGQFTTAAPPPPLIFSACEIGASGCAKVTAGETLLATTTEVMRFSITADASDDVIFDGVAHSMSFTVFASPTAAIADDFTLYDAAINKPVALTITLPFSNGGRLDFSDVAATVPRGTSKTFYVRANLGGFPQKGSTFRLSIEDGNDVLFGTLSSPYQVGAGIVGIGVPLYGETLTKP
ncbi:MAG: hypothetical protein A2939_03745 [Parcubacteria group bacterium RIFCSPLOWO2_01_FULL_48_18]|nr:MAG: hypothetical protein A2939_03745 [Parcubacteria group bacterium RIFCSPLOWO2_01_FULL_48_18]